MAKDRVDSQRTGGQAGNRNRRRLRYWSKRCSRGGLAGCRPRYQAATVLRHQSMDGAFLRCGRRTGLGHCNERHVRDLGAPDILVNAAGVSGLGQQDPASAKAWTETLRTDLIGSWLGMRTVLPHMTARGSGAIVNIGALATQQPFPLAGLGAYTAAKKPESRRSRARRRWKSPLRVLRSTASRLDRSRRR